MKYAVNIGLHLDTCKLISFKFGVMLNKTEEFE